MSTKLNSLSPAIQRKLLIKLGQTTRSHRVKQAVRQVVLNNVFRQLPAEDLRKLAAAASRCHKLAGWQLLDIPARVGLLLAVSKHNVDAAKVAVALAGQEKRAGLTNYLGNIGRAFMGRAPAAAVRGPLISTGTKLKVLGGAAVGGGLAHAANNVDPRLRDEIKARFSLSPITGAMNDDDAAFARAKKMLQQQMELANLARQGQLAGMAGQGQPAAVADQAWWRR